MTFSSDLVQYFVITCFWRCCKTLRS